MEQQNRRLLKSRVVPLALIAALTLVFFYRLAFTDLILARGDTFAYFYPYWGARDAALRAGQLPLWTPHLFMGVPLLANSQLGTFYPPNWLTVSLLPPDAIRVSILLHIAWAFGGAYLLARRAVGLGRMAALLAAGVFAFGGHVGAHVEQINQLQGLSWMPWLFLLLHRALERPLRFTPLLAMGLALQFLSGHTQTVFITGIGLGVYGLATRRWRFLPVLLIAGVIAALLASPQLIPTLEMTQVSNRRGGFNPNQATAFSFSPFIIGRGLLPAYDSLIFGEYIAYPGIIALGLALVGVFTRRARPLSPLWAKSTRGEGLHLVFKQRVRWFPKGVFTPRAFPLSHKGKKVGGGLHPSPRFVWAVVVLVGLFLAFGVYNPVYWWLASLPGFNLFRVPARWLALFALGTAMLAGLGLQALVDAPNAVRVRVMALVVGVVALLAGWSMLAPRAPELVPKTEPQLISFIGWGIALVVLIALFVAVRARANWLAPGLLVAALAELFAASQILPYNDLATPDAYSAPRFTISQLLAYQEDEVVPGRFLSISQLFFDPGDIVALEARYAALGLSPETVASALDTIKMKETLAANLPLAWGIPTIDGFDGGLLPTAYYTAFTSLMLPEGELRTIDGRLREILARPECRGACLPDRRWLNLTNTQYLITDKIYDLWHEDIAYDMQFELVLAGGGVLIEEDIPTFEANALYILYRCVDDECDPPGASWRSPDGEMQLVAAPDIATVDIYRLARLGAAGALTPTALEISSAENVRIGAATLVDERTGDFAQLTFDGWERRLSSDIKLYENETVMPRAFVIHDWWTVADHEWGTEDALNLMRDRAFDPWRTAVISEGNPGPVTPVHESAEASEPPDATITLYTAGRVEISVQSSADGYLILSDAYYPGWTATVNEQPAHIVRADAMLRAARVPPGESRVVFMYQPAWLPAAPLVGLAAWAAAVLSVLALWRRSTITN